MLKTYNSSHTIFLDEAGNTGSEFLSTSQPNMVIGGWIVPNKNISTLNKKIIEFELDYSKYGHELKGKNLSKHVKGKNLMLKIISEMSKNACWPISFIIEKKYLVCGKIVELYFDPAYNDAIDFSEQLDLESRQGITQTIYDTNSPLIAEFASAYKTQNVDQLINLGPKFSHTMRAKNEIRLSKLFIQNNLKLRQGILDEFNIYKINNKYASLNYTMIFAILQYVQNKIPYPVSLIHDNIDSFADVYNEVYTKFSANKSEEVLEFLNKTRLSFNLSKITSFEFKDSKITPLLRAADYSASANYEFIKKIMNSSDIDDSLTQIAFHTIGAIFLKSLTTVYSQLSYVPDSGMVFASVNWTKKVFGKFKQFSTKN